MTRATSLEEAIKLVDEVERVILTVKGKEVAVMSPDDLRLFEGLEDQRDIEEAERRLKTETPVSYERVRKELGLE